MKFLPKVGLGPFSSWFHFGGHLDWIPLSFSHHSRPARLFQHKIDCRAEMVRDTAKFRSDSVHVAPRETAVIIIVEMIRYCGQMSHGKWGPLLSVVGVSACVGKYIALLISLLGMSGAAPSTWLMRALNLRGSCSWLGERKWSWMVTNRSLSSLVKSPSAEIPLW